MDINLLVQRLRHGDSYTVQNEDNAQQQIIRPPNSLMIKAANVITALDQRIQQTNQAMHSLQSQLNELAQQYETLRNSSSTTTSS